MADPVSPVTTTTSLSGLDVTLDDESGLALTRRFSFDVAPGTATRTGSILEWSVSPGESTATRRGLESADEVDLTHVRAVFRLSGISAHRVLEKICALDLTDDMFPTGAAARTTMAGVTIEVVRDDFDGLPSFLLLPSRSFGNYFWGVLVDADTGAGRE